MLPLFIFILMCSPCISIASDSLSSLEQLAAIREQLAAIREEKKTKLNCEKKSPFSAYGTSFNPESVSAELALAKAMQSRSPVSGTNSPETGSLRRPNSQLTNDSGATTPTNASHLPSANATPVPSLQSSAEAEPATEASALSLLFS